MDTLKEAIRKILGTLSGLEEDWKSFISTQVASKIEFSSPCIPCVLLRTSKEINYPKKTSIATTTSNSGRAREIGSGSGSGLKDQNR
ncbi:hypothetical protein O181_059326 [Austropuccinia psidii MF-1]|uniref:Uncharacterized protein n=1 Tax=Austropuccinia psidii MF-1 TaxID=1389203 RepID=A0A9Q3HVK8_9BASI|nr:hypothetical protein [Austropuccinia psidii MF-1]